MHRPGPQEAAAFRVFGLARPTAAQPYIAGLLDPCTNSKLAPNIPAEKLYDKQVGGRRVYPPATLPCRACTSSGAAAAVVGCSCRPSCPLPLPPVVRPAGQRAQAEQQLGGPLRAAQPRLQRAGKHTLGQGL